MHRGRLGNVGKLGVVIVAAGKGKRMGAADSKQYLMLGDRPILVHTLQLFERMAEVDAIMLVTGPDDVQRCEAYVDTYGLSKLRAVVPGGAERQHSVREGLAALAALPGGMEWVLVHDAVRPFARPAHIEACWRSAMETGAAVLAVPVKDTIKIVDERGRIQSTPDRRSLWAIQTPQAFRLSLLREAHERARDDGFIGTDDAMLMERIGVAVQVVESDYTNIKITTPEDLPWAEWILRERAGRGDKA
jgi:2-C-methyl-D-erythritol 4-phosphate cytidylyltransferase